MRRLAYPVTFLVVITLGSAHSSATDLVPELIGSWPGFRRGEARAVTISGNYAYVAGGQTGLHVLDVSNPSHPRRVGGVDTDGLAQGVAVSGNYVYLANGSLGVWDTGVGAGLRVIDVSDPVNPRRVGGVDTDGSARGVAVSGDYVYLADGGLVFPETGKSVGAGLRVIDVSDPVNPRRVGRYETSGQARGVAVSGNYVYLADEGLRETDKWVGAGLHVIDVSDPVNPQRVGRYETNGQARGVAVSGNYVYLAEDGYLEKDTWIQPGVRVIDVSNPAIPQLVRSDEFRGYPQVFAFSGRYAFVAESSWEDNQDQMRVIDLGNPWNPRTIGSYATGGFVSDVTVSGRYAYVLARGWEPAEFIYLGPRTARSGLEVVDIIDPTSPQRAGRFDTAGYSWDLVLSGDHAYVADGTTGLQILDVRNPSRPERLGSFALPGWAHGVSLAGKYAYVTEAQPRQAPPPETNVMPGQLDRGRLNVIDISEAGNPKRVASYETSWPAVSVAISGDYAYLADGLAGLQVIDVGDPANPQRIGGLKTVWAARRVAVSGRYACVVAGYGFEVIDIDDSTNPQRKGWYDRSGWANDAAVSGNYVYLVATPRWDEATKALTAGGLQVVDLSNPANPRRVGGYGEDKPADRVVVSGNYALIVGESGVQVIDVSDPARPQRVGVRPFDDARAVWVRGDKVYVAAGSDGLAVLHFAQLGPRLEPMLRRDASGFHLLLRAAKGQAVRLQRSSDLKNWADWQVVSGTGDSQGLVDPNIDAGPARFYRATLP